MSSDRQQTSDDWDARTKTSHALTREQCSLCTANRPRLCDQHYKQGADELLKRVTDAIQDQQTPGGVKATYEQLLELCNQQRQALAQQAQEIERLKRDNRLLNEHITCCRAENAEKLSQLAAMTAERDEACGELLVSLDDAPIGSLAGKLVTANRVLRSHLATLQATLAERGNELEAALAEQRVLDSKYVDERAARFKAQDEADQYYKCLQIEKGEHATALAERDTARQNAARLREAAHNLTCAVCKLDMQRALKGA